MKEPGREAANSAWEAQVQSAIAGAQSDFSELGETIDKSLVETAQTVLSSGLPQAPMPTPLELDSGRIRAFMESIIKALPSRPSPENRWLAKRFGLAVLTKLANEQSVRLTAGFRIAPPARDTIFDPLDPDLRNASTWKSWQTAVLGEILSSPVAGDPGVKAAASLLLWGGPCDPSTVERISQIVPSRDYDASRGTLTYPAGSLPMLRWSCHPAQKIALIACLRTAPDVPLCAKNPSPMILRWLSRVCPDPPRSLQEILVTERRYLLDCYPPWMVAVLAGLHDAPSGVRREKHVNPPLNPHLPAGAMEKEVRRKLSLEKRSFLHGQLSTRVQNDFAGKCEGLLRQLAAHGIRGGHPIRPSEASRLVNLRYLLTATARLAKQTESSSTMSTFLGRTGNVCPWAQEQTFRTPNPSELGVPHTLNPNRNGSMPEPHVGGGADQGPERSATREGSQSPLGETYSGRFARRRHEEDFNRGAG